MGQKMSGEADPATVEEQEFIDAEATLSDADTSEEDKLALIETLSPGVAHRIAGLHAGT